MNSVNQVGQHNPGYKQLWLLPLLLLSLAGLPLQLLAEDADGISGAADLDNDNDGILDTDEGYATVVPSPLASSFNISTSTQPGTSGTLSPASISGFVVTDTSGGNQLSFTAQTTQTQTSNDPTNDPITHSGTLSEVTIDADRDPEEVITASTFTYSTGSNFDDGLYVEINDVVVVEFSQWDWQNEPGFSGGDKFDTAGGGGWTPWNGEGNPELTVDFITGTVSLMLDTVGGGREDALDDMNAVAGVNVTPNPVPTPDWNSPVKVGASFLNHGGPGGIDIQTLEFSLEFMTHRDTDGDGVFDYLDIDSDNDGISDLYESGADAAALDPDNNAVIDGAQFVDADSDGLADAIEATEGANNGTTPLDTDSNGTPDFLDLDTDGDGIPDAIEAQLTSVYSSNYANDGNVSNDDSDGDGAIDAYDSGSGHGGVFNTPVNTDSTGEPDYRDPDADGDGTDDSDEGGSAITGISYNDPDGSAHNGSVFNLPDTDGDVDADGGNAIPLSQDFDYREQADYGDAPASYGAASHYPAADLYLGAGQPDLDPGNQASVGADGDDIDGNDDEDGTTIVPLNNAVTDYSLAVSVTNSSGSTATLYGWVDFDGDGSFDQNERTTVSVPNGTSGDLSLDWSGIAPSVGISYVRLRLSADDLTSGESNDGNNQDDISIGAEGDGEVEDYRVIISDASEIYFEAECAIIGDDWLIRTDPAASENVYVEPDNNRTNNLNTSNQVAANMLQYQVTVPIPDTYDLYALVEANGGDNDSFFYSLNATNSWTTLNNLNNGAGFDWVDLENTVSGGQPYQEITTTTPNQVVNIYISWREDGILVDKFALLSDDSAVPTGQGDPVGGCFDFGDAPDPVLNSTGSGDYISLFGNNTPGPLHAVDSAPAVYLGSLAPDTESDAQQNIDATGDDSSDEGTAQLLSAATGDSFPALVTSDSSYSFTVDVTNDKAVAATLMAWIDFDRDGQFESGELADTNPTIAGGAGSTTATLTWTGLSGLTVGNTFVRLRVSTDVELTTKNSTDVVIDGEVEDHQIGIYDIDFGDAPVASYGSASHYIQSPATLYLGPPGDQPDMETATQQGGDAGAGADADDNDGNDDENGVTSFPALTAGDTGTYSLDVDFVNTGANAQLSGWIDFDGDGVFEDDEFATTTVTSGSSSPATLNFDLDALSGGINAGVTYARLRITRDSSILSGSAATSSSIGLAEDGEVEDHLLSISGLDYGDAPASYGDASHLVDGVVELYLGAQGNQPDSELASQVSVGADGDDQDGNDDEAAVASFPPLTESDGGSTYELEVTYNNTAADADSMLYGWIDFNGDGDFADPGEAASAAAISGATDAVATLSWTVPSGANLVGGDTYVRLRLTTDAAVTTSTPASPGAQDGEVEDYALTIFEQDFGDAPLSYGEANHLVSNNLLYLGSTLPDTETGTLLGGDAGAGADGDDAGGDEGVVQLLSSGSAFPGLNAESTSYQLTVDVFNNTGGTARLYAWIDFDRNGSFDEDEVGTVTTTINSSGTLQTKTISWSGLGTTTDIQAGLAYARFRLTSQVLTNVGDGGADERAQGAASSGEVEDYAIGIGNRDYGDAPDSGVGQGPGNYRSLLADNGPRHTITSGIRLGDTSPDIDTNAFGDGNDSTGNAGDDEMSGGDEGIAQLLVSGNSDFPALLSTDSSYSLDVRMANTSGGAVRIFAWIDFDQSGTFDEDEAADATGLIGNVTSRTLTWSSIPDDVTGGIDPSYIRFRITSDPLTNNGSGEDERSYGAASTGEVEDYPITITAVDFGDAPDSYGTLDASDGASHQVVSGVYLGDAAPDGEKDGFVDGSDDNLFARDDDLDGADEGIDQLLNGTVTSFPALNTGDTTYGPLVLDIATNTDATVYAWIDFDQDGIFEESERAEASVSAVDNTVSLSWNSLPAMSPGNAYARFRIATDGSIVDGNDADDGVADDASRGGVDNGEVEDYRITISGSGSISGRVFEDPNYGGGIGRDYATANSSYSADDVGTAATVELWASDGNSCIGGAPVQTTTSDPADGSYSFTGVAVPGDFCLRVLSTSVQTNRTHTGSPIAVQTYRVESTDGLGTLDAISDEIGGRSPADQDSAANTFDDSYGDNTASHSWSIVSVDSAGISGIDFGYSFNTIVNTNSAGQGSLRQFIANANAMNDAVGDGLAQQGQNAGIDVSIFEIPGSDPNYNLSGQGEYSIALESGDGALPAITVQVELNATTQSGISCPVPRMLLEGSALGAVDGLDIGGTADGSLVRGFVINGFGGYAIDLAADNSILDCNYIGTDVGGNSTGNGGNGAGIRIIGSDNQIGGSQSIAANVISGNSGDGLQISGDNNLVQGNFIGLGANGASQVANSGQGVLVSGSGNQIGDSASALLRNRIAYNGGDGVRISAGSGNLVTANNIFNNGGLGLNLVGGSETNGVTANDSGDGDSGANNLLNYLTWNSVVPNGNDLEYDLDVDVPTGSYRIEFYANAVCNANQAGAAQTANYGEGQQLLGSVSFTSNGSPVNIDSDLDAGDNFTELGGVVPGLVGGEISALVIDDSNGHTSEFAICETAIAAQVISGTVFEDVNYGGGAGRDYSTANADYSGNVGTQATVELWSSDGVLCTGGAPIQTVTSDATDGSYSFNVVATGAEHCVRVINSSVRSNRSGWTSSLIPVQTYRTEYPNDAAGSLTEITDEVGGESPQDADVGAGIYDRNAGDGNISQSVSFVDLPDDGTTPVTGIDFGFNFDTIVNVDSSGQGSLRQFILNANALGDETDLAQSGVRLAASSTSTEALPAQTETSIFMISNASAGVDGINPTRPNLLVGAQYADITLATSIAVNDASTNIDGTTLSANINNPNGGLVGSTEAVGATGATSLPRVYRPEVQIRGATINLAANDVEVRGIAFLPTSTALNISSSADVLIENNIFGAGAVTYADPGTGSNGDLVSISGTASGTRAIHNNLFGFGDASGLSLVNTSGWSITENEFQGFGTAGVTVGDNATSLDIGANLFANNALGLRLANSGSNSASTIDNNSIRSNTGVGLRIDTGASGENNNSISANLIRENGDDGVQFNAGSGNTLSQNSIYNNQGLGINLTGSANAGALVPVITAAITNDGSNIDISGTYAGASSDALEFYSGAACNPDTAGMAQMPAEGEGQTFHATTDTDGGSGFSVQIPIADVAGSVITVMSTDGSGNSSEFGACVTALISDWGDAPESYGTSAAAMGPNHVRNDSLKLGATIDAEEDGFVDGVDDSGTASDDDMAGDDEDGVASFPSLTTAASSYSIDVSLENSTGANAYLVGWIDFDLNGTFDSNESAMVTVNNGASSATLTWNSVPIDIAVGSSFVRLRYSSYGGAGETPPASAAAASPLGGLLSGEVEDYPLSIAQGYDYGDAPASFDSPTPARHLRDGNSVYLGLVPPDGDADSFGGDGTDDGYGSNCSFDGSSGLAQDDDCEGLDDEDSATLLGLTPSDTSYTAQAVVTNNTGDTVYAWAWLDINQNGEFESGEGVEESLGGVNSSGSTVVTFNWPSFSSLSVGDTFLRIRVSSDPVDSSDAVGDLSDGEVEDYRIVVSQLTCDVIYGQYNDGSYSDLRTFNTATGALGPVLADSDGDPGNFNVGSAGSGIDPITRRYYYAEWAGDTNGNGAIDLYYFDGASHVDTGANLQNGGETDNWNRLAFNPSGVGYAIEDDTYEILSFDTATHTLTNEGTVNNFYLSDGVTNAPSTGAGGDIAFDVDGNLYMVTYETAAENDGDPTDEFFLWIIEDMGASPSARLLISGDSGGEQVAGIAFYSDNLLYLQDAAGDTVSWNVGTNTINVAVPNSVAGSGDLASCIYPQLVPVLSASKTVSNLTDPESPGFAPGDVLEYRVTVRNTGGIAASNVDFVDAIPANTAYVPNSTYIERRTSGSTSPVQVPDVGGSFPYVSATEIHSEGQADGTMLAVPSAGSLANGVVISFQVEVDSGTGFNQVCNINGVVSYTDLDNNTAYAGTNDPGTAAGAGVTNGNTETTDPTCLDKFSGYSIEGYVYEDLDSDGVFETGDGEAGISNIEVVLRHPDNSCSTQTTNASGFYFFGPLDTGVYTIYEAEGATVPTPGTCPPAVADRSGYVSTSSNTIGSVNITSANFTDQNFGDVQTPDFSPSNSNVVLPGNTVFYAHEFVTPADGTLAFSFAESGSPTPSGWSVALYHDADCNGGISGGESIIPGAEILTAGDTYCVVAQIGAPLNATAGDIQIATLTATFDYPGSFVATRVLNVADTTTVLSAGDGALVLSKLVENLSCQSGGGSYPCDYDDGTQKTDNNAQPGDVLRYSISFQNIGTTAISGIDIYDAIPAYTALDASNLLESDCTTEPGSDFSAAPSISGCTLVEPAAIDNVDGYDGNIHWQLNGSLGAGESGVIAFDVTVD